MEEKKKVHSVGTLKTIVHKKSTHKNLLLYKNQGLFNDQCMD